MLFNTFSFIFLFLPTTVIGFFLLGRASQRLAAGWLFIASLVFYGWWDYRYIPLLLASITFNYFLGRRLSVASRATTGKRNPALLWVGIAVNLALLGYYKFADFFIANSNHLLGTQWTMLLPISGPRCCRRIRLNYFLVSVTSRATTGKRNRALLWVGIAVNLALLGYYKYADFFIANSNHLLGTQWTMLHVVLPIGISFFTFTQIAFLVDAWRGDVIEYDFLRYGLFVSYFPHLIAGPILHHKEIIPQFARPETYRPRATFIAAGLAVFAVGLAKKVLVADTLATYADAAFKLGGEPQNAIAAWLGVLSFTMQIYFDFSGYSDMAIGMSLLIGVQLPLNFNSPYKAQNIIEFWRRWHMTLSRFLRDYLYIPLGGSRHGSIRRYVNLIITMLLGGLWHGAAWTFVIWGGLHGSYLVANHSFRALQDRNVVLRNLSLRIPAFVYIAITFTAVTIAWIFFRAPSVDSASLIIKAMLGYNGGGIEMFVARLNLIAESFSAAVNSYIGGTGLPLTGDPELLPLTGNPELPLIGYTRLPLAGAIPLLGLELTLIPWGGIVSETLFVAAAIGMALLAPNSQQLAGYAELQPSSKLSIDYSLSWRASLAGACATGILAAAAIYEMLNSSSTAFLYFNF